ncbi:chemotaxis response regulator protein-glutamate methylesterase [Brevibacillus fluminis]|uniref:Protein-glutamate methylesterase/protein-glutamine glutaminase n=1 Tax=Brevibacillus fluminis TaxID=511487 RepID=A0A3M8DUK6_9BACL|nr:chemotaxis response regulator protein-glutamate methylesterase [Brevibacillus fluminis]RNB91860.1 chemotaxis response regulator protein-glutamate methylesterase [Brevibacillus fluminis]
MKTIRVLVVDDSAFMRKVISDILSEDPSIEVIDRAKNGKECVEKVKSLQPDVVTLDLEMPIMNGLEALEQLMKEHPVPVVMLSSVTREGAEQTIHALELGAIDFVTKPSGSISLDIHKVADGIVEKVKAAALTRLRQRRPGGFAPKSSVSSQSSFSSSAPSPTVQPQPSEKPVGFQRPSSFQAERETASAQATAPSVSPIKQNRISQLGTSFSKLVAVGTSTGGPKALQTLLTAIPAHFPAPIVVVQHMPPGFTRSLAQRLDTLCGLHVVEAENGQALEAGTVYIAPGGYHMEVAEQSGKQLTIHLHQADPRGGHRPSVDVLFESVSKLTNVSKWAIIMTGMGSDGTKGLRLMKEGGPVTSIIEDESSCVVYGMPRSAVVAGLADHVVPLEKIAETLVRLVN